MVVGDGRLQDSEFCNISERGRERDHQRSFGAETPLITNTRAPPCHDPPPSHTHTHMHVNPHLLCQPPWKVDPYYPPSQTRSALSTSSGQLQTKKPEMRGVSATWPGSANPLTLALSFLLSPSFLCPQKKKERKERIAISFLRASLLSPRFFLPFSSLSRSFMPLCVHLHGHDEGPHAGWLGSLKGLRRDGERWKEREERDGIEALMERKEREE